MDGILLIDKPAGMGSAQVVGQIKRLVKPARVGHLGTLDPFATGLLPILLGEATKLARFLDHGNKNYRGVIALGAETDTLDRSGSIVKTAPVPELIPALLAEIAARFTGTISQVPPIYSAIKRDGVPLYKLARRGEDVAPPEARTVTIEKLELAALDRNHLHLCVTCSPGTYVRTLARDVALALGTTGHLLELRRERTAGFEIAQAHALAEIVEEQGALGRALIGLDGLLPAMTAVEVDGREAAAVRNGDASVLRGLVRLDEGTFKIVHRGGLIAIAEAGRETGFRLLRVIVRQGVA